MKSDLGFLSVIMAFVLFFLLISCSQSTNTSEETVDQELLDEAASNPENNRNLTALGIVYQVTSWEAWKKGFDEKEEERASQGFTTLGIVQSADRKNEVTVFLQTESIAKARQVYSEKIATYHPGEKSPVTFYRILSMSSVQFPQKYRVLITHEVEDYDHWRMKFDEHQPSRREAGLEIAGIAKGVENENVISVMFAFDDMESARVYAESEELEKAMEEAGVIGDPEVYWYEIPPEE